MVGGGYLMPYKFNPFTGNLDQVVDTSEIENDINTNEEILYINSDPEAYESLAETPIENRNYFMPVNLHNDEQYIVVFGGNTLTFLDCRNPYAVEQILNITVNNAPGAFGQPQAMASIGDYIFVCATNGKIHTIDWSDRSAPIIAAEATISSGQHYDMASNGLDTLFIANTTNNQFIAIDASNPLALVLINTVVLSGFGAGVAAFGGYAYCTNFQAGQVHTFEFSGGTWNEIDITASSTNATRLGVGSNSEGDNFLISNRYSGPQFSLHDLVNPANIGAANTFATTETINIYSRGFSVDGILYLNTTIGNVLSYNIRDINDISFIGSYEPKYPDETKRFIQTLGSVSFVNFGAVTRNTKFILAAGSNVEGVPAQNNRGLQVLELPLIDVTEDNTRLLATSKTIGGVGLYYEITVDSITVTLPSSPFDGDIFNIANFSSGEAIINGNGNNIMGLASQTIFADESFNLIYNQTEWKLI